MRLSQDQLRGAGSRRRRFADARQMGRLRDLARQARVEMPSVVWAGEARDAIRQLEKHLAHRRQPMLEGME